MSIANKPKIIIAAIASRPYVRAAVDAGYAVVAIDAFADVEVQQLATQCYQIDCCDGVLDRFQLIELLDRMDLRHFLGFCYGAGFEKSPSVLMEINKRVTVFGNSSEVVEQCKSPAYFFALCHDLSVPTPSVVYKPPLNTAGWLRKEVGGSGGGHIQWLADANEVKTTDVYYQQAKLGMPISCLFLSDGHTIKVIGFNAQWLGGDNIAPFRYCGAVSHADISDIAKARLTTHVAKLSKAMGLLGVNSCDAICDGDAVTLLEINPRLSATMGLYQQPLLMTMHIAASQGRSIPVEEWVGQDCYAHQVIYAERRLRLKDDIIWPAWVCDIPQAGQTFSQGQPICTVTANAKTAVAAMQLVQERAVALSNKLCKLNLIGAEQ